MCTQVCFITHALANGPVLEEAAGPVGCFRHKYKSLGFGRGEHFLVSKSFSYIILPGLHGNPVRGGACFAIVILLNCLA